MHKKVSSAKRHELTFCRQPFEGLVIERE